MSSKVRLQIAVAASSMFGLIAIGTVVYRYLEDWTWIQSFYFTVVTLTTVGFGDLHPTTDGARLFTAFFIMLGVAIALSALGVIGTSYLTRRGERVERISRRRQRGNDSG